MRMKDIKENFPSCERDFFYFFLPHKACLLRCGGGVCSQKQLLRLKKARHKSINNSENNKTENFNFSGVFIKACLEVTKPHYIMVDRSCERGIFQKILSKASMIKLVLAFSMLLKFAMVQI